MSLLAALNLKKRVALEGAGAYVCKAPTLGTLALASGLFPRAVVGLARVGVADPSFLLQSRIVPAILTLFDGLTDPRVADVLETCVEPVAGQSVSLGKAVALGHAKELAAACASLVDWPHVFEHGGLKEAAEVDETVDAPDGTDRSGPLPSLDAALYLVSQRYGRSPMEVVGWPLSVFADAIRLLAEQARGVPRTRAASVDEIGVTNEDGTIDAAALASMIPGIGYEMEGPDGQ
jgi:hypothetical protein